MQACKLWASGEITFSVVPKPGCVVESPGELFKDPTRPPSRLFYQNPRPFQHLRFCSPDAHRGPDLSGVVSVLWRKRLRGVGADGGNGEVAASTLWAMLVLVCVAERVPEEQGGENKGKPLPDITSLLYSAVLRLYMLLVLIVLFLMECTLQGK